MRHTMLGIGEDILLQKVRPRPLAIGNVVAKEVTFATTLVGRNGQI